MILTAIAIIGSGILGTPSVSVKPSPVSAATYRLPKPVKQLASFDNTVWAATDDGLYQFQNGKWINTPDSPKYLTCLSADTSELWYAERDTGTIRCIKKADACGQRAIPVRISLPFQRVAAVRGGGRHMRDSYCMAVDARSVWVGTAGYLLRYDRQRNQWREVLNVGDVVRVLSMPGKVWIGTSMGLIEMREKNGVYRAMPTKLVGYDINSLAMIDNVLYVGGSNMGWTPKGCLLTLKEAEKESHYASVWRLDSGSTLQRIYHQDYGDFIQQVSLVPLSGGLCISAEADTPKRSRIVLQYPTKNQEVAMQLSSSLTPFRTWARVGNDLWTSTGNGVRRISLPAPAKVN